jgi:hypothetical protein
MGDGGAVGIAVEGEQGPGADDAQEGQTLDLAQHGLLHGAV